MERITIGSNVIFINNSGQYPYMDNGNVEAIYGTKFLIKGRLLEASEFSIDYKIVNIELYKLVKQRIRVLQSLMNRLAEGTADESILQD